VYNTQSSFYFTAAIFHIQVQGQEFHVLHFHALYV